MMITYYEFHIHDSHLWYNGMIEPKENRTC